MQERGPNLKHYSFALITFLVMNACLLGQTPTATLSGVVRDSSGAVISGAKIRVNNIATGATRATVTDSDGRYSLTNLDPGPYELQADMSGFKTAARRDIVLTVGGSEVVDL